MKIRESVINTTKAKRLREQIEVTSNRLSALRRSLNTYVSTLEMKLRRKQRDVYDDDMQRCVNMAIKMRSEGSTWKEVKKAIGGKEQKLRNVRAYMPDERSVMARRVKCPVTMASSVNDLRLTVRIVNCLNNAGITTVSQLLSIPRMTLLKYRNFGENSFLELDAELERHGFKLHQ